MVEGAHGHAHEEEDLAHQQRIGHGHGWHLPDAKVAEVGQGEEDEDYPWTNTRGLRV